MSLFYDERIRQVVVERWAATNLPDFKGSDIPENQVDPEDSALLKDTRIPLHFKNAVAQALYDAEEEEIKEQVRSKRDEDLYASNIRNVSDEKRVELVRAYQR